MRRLVTANVNHYSNSLDNKAVPLRAVKAYVGQLYYQDYSNND
jgi:hypothetical protein